MFAKRQTAWSHYFPNFMKNASGNRHRKVRTNADHCSQVVAFGLPWRPLSPSSRAGYIKQRSIFLP